MLWLVLLQAVFAVNHLAKQGEGDLAPRPLFINVKEEKHTNIAMICLLSLLSFFSKETEAVK